MGTVVTTAARRIARTGRGRGGPWTQRAVQEEMDRQDGWARMEAAL